MNPFILKTETGDEVKVEDAGDVIYIAVEDSAGYRTFLGLSPRDVARLAEHFVWLMAGRMPRRERKGVA